MTMPPAATYLDWLRARYPQQLDHDDRLNDYLTIRGDRLCGHDAQTRQPRRG